MALRVPLRTAKKNSRESSRYGQTSVQQRSVRRPEWDVSVQYCQPCIMIQSTLSDLSVHKMTPEQVVLIDAFIFHH